MSYIDTIPVNDATGEVRQMYERQQEASTTPSHFAIARL
jgi:hypothetical protein